MLLAHLTVFPPDDEPDAEDAVVADDVFSSSLKFDLLPLCLAALRCCRNSELLSSEIESSFIYIDNSFSLSIDLISISCTCTIDYKIDFSAIVRLWKSVRLNGGLIIIGIFVHIIVVFFIIEIRFARFVAIHGVFDFRVQWLRFTIRLRLYVVFW